MKITPGTKFKSVDDYISIFPEGTQKILETLRSTIKKAAPQAEEVISYNIPAYKLNGALVFFAGYKNHIGFYPTSSGIKYFAKELSAYKTSKGAIQFPVNELLPLKLITKMVKFRIEENAKLKANEKSS